MKEQEYLDLSDRVRVGIAYKILSGVIPENSSVIEKKEYQDVMKIISSWEMKFFNISFIE